MLLQQGKARNERVDLNLACTLASVAGALNASAFYSVGFFSANMTGNVSALSDHIAIGQWQSALFYFSIVFAFIFGASVSTVLINTGRRRHIHGIYAYSVLTEAILLALLGCADLWLFGAWHTPVVVLGLAFLMGLQNAVVTRISDARVRTTHVSGMATDIGIELGIALDILRGRDRETDAAHNRSKLRLHLYTIAAFLLGGVVGVVIYQAVGGWLLIAAAILLFAIAVTGISQSRRIGDRMGSSDRATGSADPTLDL
ncbi:DUF1275 domain-containing protein [Allorhizobium sp. BGMRC 0089]|uniref:YoaK family protein n=1 Tax=Allorhizobium sonneratiae TaxID=2934936 RepID=UPI002033B50A|nr:YoaK family protein [Allorhizobium sonneratiae]MCM2292498.1 DUF1275 domain-containing protein [Allorhizobium sonneratiae]